MNLPVYNHTSGAIKQSSNICENALEHRGSQHTSISVVAGTMVTVENMNIEFIQVVNCAVTKFKVF
jgi:hypothetical protein